MSAPPPKPPSPIKSFSFTASRGTLQSAQKIGIYGTGGIGKTSLVRSLIEVGIRPLILDLDDGSKAMDVDRVCASDGLNSWDALHAALTDNQLCGQYDAVCVDTGTKAEELATKHTLATVKNEKGHLVDSIEGYGYGRGYMHVYETFLRLFLDLEGQVRLGRHAILICHDCTDKRPNPMGEDWLQYEPQLQHSSSGRASNRQKFKSWADHLFFINLDVNAKDGKGQGHGSRTIYVQEAASHVAKSRTLKYPVPYVEGNADIWKQLFVKE